MQFIHLKSARWALLALIPAVAVVFCLFLPRKIAVSDELLKRVSLPPAPWGFVVVRDTADNTENAQAKHGRLALTIRETDFLSPTDTGDSPENSPSSTGGSVRSYPFARDRLVSVAADGKAGKTVRKPLSGLDSDERIEFAATRSVTDPDYPLFIIRVATCRFTSGKIPERLEKWLTRAFPAPESDDTVFIGAVGDLMPGRGVERILKTSEGGKSGLERVFDDTLSVLKISDIMIGNLEGAVTDGSAKATKSYTFKYNPDILPYLKDAGFTYLMLTNNHSFDYGQEGFTDTLDAVRKAGFATSGAGMNSMEAEVFWRTTIRGQQFSVLSCGAYPVEKTGFDGSKTAAATDTKPGILWESPRVSELVKKEKETGAFVIVCVHGGEEYHTRPSVRQQAFYRSLADSGADVVFGSHPHVLQPIERYGNSLIVYSLGNFLFPGMGGMPGAEESMIVRIGVSRGKIILQETYPARLSGTRVALEKQ